jgi:cytochrome b subunit of formate dehydrogenase
MSWRKAHVLITLVAGALLTLTGIALWVPRSLPLALLDASLEVHIWATWVFAASLPVHLVVARRKIVERVRMALGGEPPPLFEFGDDADEEPP